MFVTVVLAFGVLIATAPPSTFAPDPTVLAAGDKPGDADSPTDDGLADITAFLRTLN